jgi:hypothetical protein
MHFSPAYIAAFAGLTATVHCTPIQAPSTPALIPRGLTHTITGCTDDQKKHIVTSLTQVSGLAVGAYGVLTNGDGWKTNKGYTHYFKESDYDMVKKAYDVLISEGSDTDPVKFDIRCGAKDDCPSGSFAYADPTEENFEGHGHTKGTRVVTICPEFFTSPRTTRDLPSANDKDGLKKYCEHKESKKIMDFEVGGMSQMLKKVLGCRLTI